MKPNVHSVSESYSAAYDKDNDAVADFIYITVLVLTYYIFVLSLFPESHLCSSRLMAE